MADFHGYEELPRGGYVVATSEGRIQFGAPPETIKCTLTSEEGVPEVFVLPRPMFSWNKGINVADMEFPIYYHFFIRRHRPLVCGTLGQARSLAVALQESVFGPRNFDLRNDTIDIGDDVFVPDIRPELSFFRGDLDLKSLFRFRPFQDGVLTIGSVTVTEKNGAFEVQDNGNTVAVVPETVEYKPRFDVGRSLPEPFIPPRFGVTCLGPSHGFDPADSTSGFIIWLNHNGIMVDPPVNSTEWLVKSNVNPKFIDSIILTHCHADHDAGTFQKILEENRITIYTTKTIMESFLRKYSAFSGETPRNLRKLFDFQPIYIGRPVMIHGGEFDINYALHSIPTMSFRLSFQGKTFVYSSDHQGDPEVQSRMFQDGVIGKERFDQLRNFPWQSDVIYHESGIAPLHTPLSFLNSLPEDVQSRTVVYHISRKDFEAIGATSLKRATFGIENTLYFETEKSVYEDAYRALDILKRLDFFETLPVKKVQEFLSIIERRHFKRGDKIIEIGTPGDYFYIIENGNASIMTEKLVRQKQVGAFEYFGEIALLTERKRTADIIADTDIDAIVIPRNRFVNFVTGTEFGRVLRRIVDGYNDKIWNLLVESETFARLTDYQRLWLETSLEPVSFADGDTIASPGAPLPGVYFVHSGVALVQNGSEQDRVSRGDAIGWMDRVAEQEACAHTVTAAGPVEAFMLSISNARDFVNRNPGVAKRVVPKVG